MLGEDKPLPPGAVRKAAGRSQAANVPFVMFSRHRSHSDSEHEAGVEIPGQDEMSEEALHYPLPRLPRHLPPLPQPLH